MCSFRGAYANRGNGMELRSSDVVQDNIVIPHPVFTVGTCLKDFLVHRFAPYSIGTRLVERI